MFTYGSQMAIIHQILSELIYDVYSHRAALLHVLQKNDAITDDDFSLYNKLVAREKAKMDQEHAKQIDLLRNADTPAGEQFRLQEELEKRILDLFDDLVGKDNVGGLPNDNQDEDSL